MAACRFLLFSLLFWLAFTASAQALVLTPRSLLSQSLVQQRQEAVALLKDGQQELWLRLKLKAWPALKKDVVWVLSLPSKPSKVRTLKHDALKGLHRWSDKHLRRTKAQASDGSPNPEKLAAVGPYAFQSLPSHQLNGWLRKQGFASIPMGTLESIAQQQPWFLVVRISFRKALEEGWLPPIRVVFGTRKLHVPLLLTGYQALRHLRLVVVNDRPVDTYGSFYALRMLRVVQRGKYDNLLNTDGYHFNQKWPAKALPPALKKWAGGQDEWFVHVFDRPNPNPKRHLLNFDSDFTLSLGMTAREKAISDLRKEWLLAGRNKSSLQRRLFQWLPPSEARNAKRLREKLWGKAGFGGGPGGKAGALHKKVAKFMNQKVKDRSQFRWFLLTLGLLMTLGIGLSIWWRWREHRKVQQWVEESEDEHLP